MNSSPTDIVVIGSTFGVIVFTDEAYSSNVRLVLVNAKILTFKAHIKSRVKRDSEFTRVENSWQSRNLG